ncbi:hypothetical protein L2E82_10953 [Cichorium intybus]|uniref:Uncharacterized protein n=1 Tax=Cichorium intybus TaxID=13427 RepID=A0ACB9GCP1_CICIN|nr:hypothetical protein L2E82_10953 [Cichorium intybus]
MIKDLTSTLYFDEENDFEELLYLETLELFGSGSRKRESTEPLRGEPNLGKKQIRFPAVLKELSIIRCHLPWSDMSIIQSLPNLEVLVLEDNGFEGTLWETVGSLSLNFPRLEQLKVGGCVDLELGDIPTLQTIEVSYSAPSLRRSLLKIQKEL